MSIDEKLDEALEPLTDIIHAEFCSGDNHWCKEPADNAKAAIKQIILDVIGEDDDPMDLKNFNLYAELRNRLRDEQRKLLEAE